ncbi:Taurine catabolism dioxygenase TauD/TfdA [Niveomyces insectorum RCEF 264]|uniref:Taurine catabolism dioxygenase TauD/TfdA n=1 Tax=Niveomyces insectorum RCEF 264 TaxID=1081102 RepID=A0A167QUT0_9HYPO|nr:Taurine catabolism dioxygenase TauD/TfdA [Niveomyces insectorum RCEF 264]
MSTTETVTSAAPATLELKAETSLDYNKAEYKYAAYLPHYKLGEQPPLEEFEHYDVGLRADPAKAALLHATPEAVFRTITPAIGTEVRGVQLSALAPQQLDELALLAAERGVVVFYDQDFADIGPERQRAYGQHFGRLHVHQMGGHIKGYPELLPVYRDFVYVCFPDCGFYGDREGNLLTGPRAGAVDREIQNNISSIKWHTDMSYEINGMGTTTFLALDVPDAGGDTLYLSTTAAYNALSPAFRAFLHGKSATHSGFSQAAVHEHRERYVRAPIETAHPIVRTHPVTGAKSLYVNRLYTRKILGLKEEESATVLNFLYNHIEHGQDWHLRVRWAPGTVVVYDNRNTQHSALRDFDVQEAVTRRHMLRITPQAERPYFDVADRDGRKRETKEDAVENGKQTA